MEITILPKNSLKIKGKKTKIEVSPALVLSSSIDSPNTTGAEVIIEGPGEYEIGGIKITAVRYDEGLVYSLIVDSVSVLIGSVATLEKMHQKLKEANILIVKCDEAHEASSLASLVTNVMILYGQQAAEVCKANGGENVKHLSKLSATIDKLPAEVETVILE